MGACCLAARATIDLLLEQSHELIFRKPASCQEDNAQLARGLSLIQITCLVPERDPELIRRNQSCFQRQVSQEQFGIDSVRHVGTHDCGSSKTPIINITM